MSDFSNFNVFPGILLSDKGHLKLVIFRDSEIETVEISEGCCYLLSGGIPHKPVREEKHSWNSY